MANLPPWPILAQGNTGKNVYALQCLLNYRNNNTALTLDGSFGPAVYSAVVAYQTANGMTADGKAGANTLSKLVAVVQSGTVNNAARAAQYCLSKFESLTIDGSFGPGSVTAAKAFQTGMGIDVDGSVGPTTWQYLFGYDAYPGGGTTPGSVYSSSGRTTTVLTSAQRTANASYILSYLMNQGFTKQAACGVLGNMQAESQIDPGLWEGGHLRDPRGGFGLVQFTSTNYATTGTPNAFLIYAYNNGLISSNLACTEVDSLAANNPKRLMDNELACLLWCCTTRGDFFKPTAGGSMDHTGYRLTFAEYKASTLVAGTLAKVFHDHYERSGDGTTGLNTRANNATNWYNSL